MKNTVAFSKSFTGKLMNVILDIGAPLRSPSVVTIHKLDVPPNRNSSDSQMDLSVRPAASGRSEDNPATRDGYRTTVLVPR